MVCVGLAVLYGPILAIIILSHGQYIFQFDLQSSNIAASLDTVAVNDGFYDPNPPWQTAFVLHQLGPDGKIYIVLVMLLSPYM